MHDPFTQLALVRAQLVGLADYGRKYREPTYVEALTDAIGCCDLVETLTLKATATLAEQRADWDRVRAKIKEWREP
jgi:hypothetical protein